MYDGQCTTDMFRPPDRRNKNMISACMNINKSGSNRYARSTELNERPTRLQFGDNRPSLSHSLSTAPLCVCVIMVSVRRTSATTAVVYRNVCACGTRSLSHTRVSSGTRERTYRCVRMSERVLLGSVLARSLLSS